MHSPTIYFSLQVTSVTFCIKPLIKWMVKFTVVLSHAIVSCVLTRPQKITQRSSLSNFASCPTWIVCVRRLETWKDSQKHCVTKQELSHLQILATRGGAGGAHIIIIVWCSHCQFLAIWLWTNHFCSVSFSFLTSKTRILIFVLSLSQDCVRITWDHVFESHHVLLKYYSQYFSIFISDNQYEESLKYDFFFRIWCQENKCSFISWVSWGLENKLK